MSERFWQRLREELVARCASFDGLAGFCLRDLTSGTTVGWQDQDIFPAASTIKIHILTTLLLCAERGALRLDERIAIARGVLVPGSGVLTYLEDPVELSLFDVAVLMILVSDNTATNLCINRVGMHAVNETIRSLGLRHTVLRRTMQDHEAISTGRENVSTPSELVETLAVLHAGRPTPLVSARALSVLSKSKPTPFRLAIPSEIKLSSKTGRMPRVRAEAGIVHLPGHPFALAVMTSYASCDDARQDSFLSDLCRIAYERMRVLANSNQYGQGLPAPTSANAPITSNKEYTPDVDLPQPA